MAAKEDLHFRPSCAPVVVGGAVLSRLLTVLDAVLEELWVSEVSSVVAVGHVCAWRATKAHMTVDWTP